MNVQKSCSSKCCKASNKNYSINQNDKNEDHRSCDNQGVCKCTLCHHFISYFHLYNIPLLFIYVPKHQDKVTYYTILLEKDFQYTIFQPPKFTV